MNECELQPEVMFDKETQQDLAPNPG